MTRHRQTSSNRGQRVAQQLHQEVAQVLRGEIKDPRIGLVTVTGVDLTPDYAYLTVHYSVIPDDAEALAKTKEGLKQAAGFVRGQIGRRVRIHTTPEVRFVHDASTADAMAMSVLIDKALQRTADDGLTPDVKQDGQQPPADPDDHGSH